MSEAIVTVKLRLKKYWREVAVPEIHVVSGKVEIFATRWPHEKDYQIDCVFLGKLPDFNHGFAARSCKKTSLASIWRRTFELEEEAAWDDAIHGFKKVGIIL